MTARRAAAIALLAWAAGCGGAAVKPAAKEPGPVAGLPPSARRVALLPLQVAVANEFLAHVTPEVAASIRDAYDAAIAAEFRRHRYEVVAAAETRETYVQLLARFGGVPDPLGRPEAIDQEALLAFRSSMASYLKALRGADLVVLPVLKERLLYAAGKDVVWDGKHDDGVPLTAGNFVAMAAGAEPPPLHAASLILVAFRPDAVREPAWSGAGGVGLLETTQGLTASPREPSKVFLDPDRCREAARLALEPKGE